MLGQFMLVHSNTTDFFLSPQTDCMLTCGNENYLHDYKLSWSFDAYTQCIAYIARQVLAQLITVHFEHKYIFHACMYLNKVNIHMCANKLESYTLALSSVYTQKVLCCVVLPRENQTDDR